MPLSSAVSACDCLAMLFADTCIQAPDRRPPCSGSFV